MKEHWYLQTKRADFKQISEQFHISPILARILRNRDVTEPEDIQKYLYPDIENLSSPWLFKDMDTAVDLIQIKISGRQKIRIICDYDVDGICAGYILLHSLKKLGAVADVVVPHRIEDGYGINEQLIQKAYEDEIDTIITCDNGIAAYGQVAYAKELGMTVIVTDHHEVPFDEEDGKRSYHIPPADAVINHKQLDCPYPYKELCGAMVAYQLIRGIYEAQGKSDRELRDLLAYGALATVCDVMDISGENRAIVSYGIQRLQNIQDIGMNALIHVCGVDKAHLSTYHLGFILGPGLNASGRLDTAKKAIELLECSDSKRAVELAEQIYRLNQERKDMTEEGVTEAARMAAQSEDRVLVLYLPNCHESIAGIIAGRIRENVHKPTIILTDSGGEIKGSGRSIEEYNMYEELTKVKQYLTKFGGHKMAAGVSLLKENIENFRKKLNENCNLTEDDLYLKVWIDLQLPLEYVSMELVEELKRLEPFGKANSKPVFAEKNLKILKMEIRGKKGEVLSMTVENESYCRMKAILFRRSGDFMEFLMERFGQDEIDKAMSGRKNKIRFMATFYPNVNEYQGRQELQIIIDRFC